MQYLLALIALIGLAFANAGETENVLSRLAASGKLSDLRWPDFSNYTTRVQSFYEATGYSPVWSRGGAVTDQARAVIEVLREADRDGLKSEDYDGPRWPDRLAQLGGPVVAQFDLALTISVMRYISDVHFGKVNPGLFHSGPEEDLPGSVCRRLVDASDVRAVLSAIEPPYEGYRRTKQALRRYLALAQESNQSGQLADLLQRLGDLPEDGSLVDAVKHFQARHGLDPDGRIGKATLAQLNTPLSVRVRQLQLALERWRWIPHHFPQPPVIVNIPEFQLRALDASFATELEMKVVVGKAYGHQTPVFSAEMKSVIFQPYRNVPRSIQLAELVPRLDRDRAYLARNGYEVVTPAGKVVTGGVIDDRTLVELRSARLRIRQTPGVGNSLGLVAFMFPNEHDVYLHGTPATELFARSRRDFSHGCIRVEQPEQLAAWVLRDQAGWTLQRIREALAGPQTIQVALDKPIPVLIVYVTAAVLANGQVHFFDDIYSQNTQLEKQLSRAYH